MTIDFTCDNDANEIVINQLYLEIADVQMNTGGTNAQIEYHVDNALGRLVISYPFSFVRNGRLTVRMAKFPFEDVRDNIPRKNWALQWKACGSL